MRQDGHRDAFPRCGRTICLLDAFAQPLDERADLVQDRLPLVLVLHLARNLQEGTEHVVRELIGESPFRPAEPALEVGRWDGGEDLGEQLDVLG